MRREGKGREENGREGRRREEKGGEGKRREEKGREGKRRKGKGSEGKRREEEGREEKGIEGKGTNKNMRFRIFIKMDSNGTSSPKETLFLKKHISSTVLPLLQTQRF